MPFDWDEANIAHIAEHYVTPLEAEEVITNHPLDLGYVPRNGEVRLRQAGETSAGRILAVINDGAEWADASCDSISGEQIVAGDVPGA